MGDTEGKQGTAVEEFERVFRDRLPAMQDVIESRKWRYGVSPQVADEIKIYCHMFWDAARAVSEPESGVEREMLLREAAEMLEEAKPMVDCYDECGCGKHELHNRMNVWLSRYRTLQAPKEGGKG